jgi:hypothetical protein
MAKYLSYLSGKIQQYAVVDTVNNKQYNVRNSFRKFKKSFFIPLGLILVVVVGVLAFALTRNSDQSSGVLGANDNRIEVSKPIAEQKIEKDFSFPLKDGAGKEVSKVKYKILNAELRDEVIVNGKRATAIKGRMFLIINLKITNDYTKTIQVNTRDYVRMSVNKNGENLAPEIHNDPVEIQASSTKYTRIGFPINDTDKDLTLSVGEIEGKKDTIKLNFSK